ncbi:hypothetical protein LXL04_000837 [Taraxacum kok-saghyz]
MVTGPTSETIDFTSRLASSQKPPFVSESNVLTLNGMHGENTAATDFLEFTAGDLRGMGEASGKV